MKQRKPLTRKTRLRPVSERRMEENRVRREMISTAYPVRPPCSVPWCSALADDAHEKLSRARGGSITDLANIAPLCRPCHTLITDTEPQWAYGLGLLRASHPLDPAVFAPKEWTDSLGRHRVLPSLAERLWAGIDASGGPDPCWPWTLLVNDHGYGRIGKENSAHRVMWRVVNGPIPPSVIIRHSCDNPPCCNPAHLLSGTPADNTRDMVERGREPHVRWPVNGRAKLSDSDIAQIRARHIAGESSRALAGAFGISRSYLSRLTRGERRGPGV